MLMFVAKGILLLAVACAALTAMPLPGFAQSLTPWVSEETPAVFCPRDEFAIGIECRGSCCDDKRLRCIARSGLSWGRNLRASSFFSEEQRQGGCRANEAVIGLACRGSYCDNIDGRVCSRN